MDFFKFKQSQRVILAFIFTAFLGIITIVSSIKLNQRKRIAPRKTPAQEVNPSCRFTFSVSIPTRESTPARFAPPPSPTPTLDVPTVSCSSLTADNNIFQIGRTIRFSFALTARNTTFDKVYVLIGSEEKNLRFSEFFTDVCRNQDICNQTLTVIVPQGEKSETLLTASDLRAWIVARGIEDKGTCTDRTPTGFGNYPACNQGRCSLSLIPNPSE